MHERADGDIAKRQRIARPDVRVFPRLDRVAHLKPHGRDNVTLLSIRVVQESDAGRAVGIVLNSSHLGGNPILVAAEVNQPVHPLVTATSMPRRDPPLVVAPARRLERHDERLFGLRLGNLFKGVHRHAPAARGRRLVLFDRHSKHSLATLVELVVPPAYKPSKISMRSPSASCTMAFFRSGRRPSKRPILLPFPGMRLVLTLTTLTPKISSTARFTCVLVALSATSKVYLFCSICLVLSSVTSGRMITSRGSISRAPPRSSRPHLSLRSPCCGERHRTH